jgi:hypothetical protein
MWFINHSCGWQTMNMVHRPQTGTTSTTMEKGQQENGKTRMMALIELLRMWQIAVTMVDLGVFVVSLLVFYVERMQTLYHKIFGWIFCFTRRNMHSLHVNSTHFAA